MLFILLYVLVVSVKDSHGRFDEWGSDYFSEDFDDQKNCKDKDLVKKLDKEGKCASTSKGEILYIFILYIMKNHYVTCKIIHSEGSDSQQWETCQAKLSKVLVEKCSETKVLEVRKKM